MAIYETLSRRIMQMKKEKERWRDAYEDIVKRISDSIDLNTDHLKKIDLNIQHMVKRLDLTEERISKHTETLEEIDHSMKQMSLDFEALSKKNHETRTDMIEFKNLSNTQLHEMKTLSDRIRKDATNMEIVTAGMDRFKKDMRTFIDDSLKSHEKSFDALNRDNLENIQERLKENTALDATLKERMDQIRELIRKEHEKIDENRNDIKKFKEHIISYMNDLLSTYENRFGMLKKDVEYSMERILKPNTPTK